jgi:hypothetical protein
VGPLVQVSSSKQGVGFHLVHRGLFGLVRQLHLITSLSATISLEWNFIEKNRSERKFLIGIRIRQCDAKHKFASRSM